MGLVLLNQGEAKRAWLRQHWAGARCTPGPVALAQTPLCWSVPGGRFNNPARSRRVLSASKKVWIRVGQPQEAITRFQADQWQRKAIGGNAKGGLGRWGWGELIGVWETNVGNMNKKKLYKTKRGIVKLFGFWWNLQKCAFIETTPFACYSSTFFKLLIPPVGYTFSKEAWMNIGGISLLSFWSW